MVAAGLILLNNAVAVVGIFFLRADLRFVHQWRLVDHKLVQLQRVPYQVLQLLHRQLPRHQVPQLLQRRLPLLQVSLGTATATPSSSAEAQHTPTQVAQVEGTYYVLIDDDVPVGGKRKLKSDV
jgi:hypothetical protein